VSKIALGTVQFGLDYGISNSTGRTSPEEVKRILRLVKANSILTLDTASGYGQSEAILGGNPLNGFEVVSKFMGVKNPDDLERQFLTSLNHLKLDCIYGYMAHRPTEVFDEIALWERLNFLKETGKIKKIGFSFYEREQITKMNELKIVPDIVQAPYNIMDNRFENQIRELKEKGVEIHTRSTFLQGLFFTDSSKLKKFFNPVKEAIDIYQGAYGNNLSGYMLKYCLNKPFIDKVVIGVNNAKQLEDNIKKVQIDMTEISLDRRFNVPEAILNPAKWP